MCLRSIHWFPRISFKPIKCYKILCERNEYLYTPYLRTYVSINNPIKASRNIFTSLFTGETLMIFNTHLRCRLISKEGVHAFTNKNDAFFASRMMATLNPPLVSYRVYEAVIPSFTFYWKGIESDIAARKLIITKEIENYE